MEMQFIPHEKLLGITWVLNPVTRKDLGRVLVQIKNTRLVRDNGTNKEGYRGQDPVSMNLLVRSSVISIRHVT